MDLKTLYKTPRFPGAFAGQNQFYRALKDVNPAIKKKQVINHLRKEDSYTLHVPVFKPKKYRRVMTKGINYLWQVDLVDMSSLSKSNKGYKWIIMCIDTFSKKLWSFKAKNKTGKVITNTLKGILTQEKPKKLETDGGTEFKNRLFRALLKKLKIKTYSISSLRKCSIVERVNRTLKTRMYRAFTSRGSHVWIDILDGLVSGYNNSYHRSIKRSPNEVTPQNESEVRDILFPADPTPPAPAKFKFGDTVRITRQKSLFQKGYEQTFSYEVFKISEVKNTRPVTYGIRDYNSTSIKGSFYESELQICDKSSGIYPVERVLATRKYRGKTQYLVKYIGYSDIFNCWVDQQDLFDL